MCLVDFEVGQGKDNVGETASIKKILSNPNILLAFIITPLPGALWTSVDPILEPELRKKVIRILIINILRLGVINTMGR